MVGAPGRATGVPLSELEAAPVPMLLTASISTEYAVPSVRPEMVRGLEVALVWYHGPVPSSWYRYPVIGALDDGAVKFTWRAPSWGVMELMVGGPGGPEGVRVPDGLENGPSPTELAASTSKMYAVPLTRPGTVADVADEPVSSVDQVVPPFDEYWMM